jgi:hypothetical protein
MVEIWHQHIEVDQVDCVAELTAANKEVMRLWSSQNKAPRENFLKASESKQLCEDAG